MAKIQGIDCKYIFSYINGFGVDDIDCKKKIYNISCEECKYNNKNKTSKYKNKKVVVDGIEFDSKHESEYYLLLKKQKEEGKINDFELQKKYELQPGFKKYGKSYRAITYTVDFVIHHLNGSIECVDVKGMETQQGVMRRKMFDFLYPNLVLTWIQKSIKYGDENGWIEYDQLKKKRAAAKKEKATKEDAVKVKKARKVAK